MKTLVTYKAKPIGDQRIEDFQIAATVPWTDPPSPVSLEDLRRRHCEEAKAIAEVLTTGLPGGTLHALLVELLAYKVCLYTVADVPAESPSLGFVRAFAEWWEQAGSNYYLDDTGLSFFYVEACRMLGRTPDPAALPPEEDA